MEKKEKDRILFIGQVIDDKGTVEIIDGTDQSIIDRVQEEIDQGNVTAAE